MKQIAIGDLEKMGMVKLPEKYKTGGFYMAEEISGYNQALEEIRNTPVEINKIKIEIIKRLWKKEYTHFEITHEISNILDNITELLGGV